MKNLITRVAVAIVVTVIVTAILPLSAFAAPETLANGKIMAVNTSPEVLSLTLYESNRTTAATQMTPQTEYALKIKVKDANKLSDLTQLVATVFYDTNRNQTGTAPDTGNVQTAAIFTWTNAGGWTLTSPTGTTWAIVTGTGKSEAPPSMNTVSGDFYLHFKPGKVAKETAGSNDDWDFTAVATDQAAATGSLSIYGTLMLWYGELSASIADNSVSLKATANSNYRINTKSAESNYTRISGDGSYIGPTTEQGNVLTIDLQMNLAGDRLSPNPQTLFFQISN